MSEAHERLETLRSGIAESLALRGLKLVAAHEVESGLKRAAGLTTGWADFDRFLTSGGFPCGEISLLEAPEGLGAMTLWLDTARQITDSGRRVAWLNYFGRRSDASLGQFQLHASTAAQRGVDLSRLFLVNEPDPSAVQSASSKRLWILKEMLSTDLFSLIGCDLGDGHLPLREGRSLLQQARRSGAAVVLISRPVHSGGELSFSRSSQLRTLASTVLEFRPDRCTVMRASHRPVPKTLPRRERHVEFISSRTLDSSFVLQDPSQHSGQDDRKISRS
ncbi:MAG: hypothetical protein U1E10_15150 [Bdellovibrionales bacterium]|nr:hypothetical protein [Bdellovibrionales bacterium]